MCFATPRERSLCCENAVAGRILNARYPTTSFKTPQEAECTAPVRRQSRYDSTILEAHFSLGVLYRPWQSTPAYGLTSRRYFCLLSEMVWTYQMRNDLL